jgi:pantoate--beta-alanine ligase
LERNPRFAVFFTSRLSLCDKYFVALQSETTNRMKVITKISDLQGELSHAREQGKSIGLVPTMGALHEGHAALVKQSVGDNDVTVVSDFVNPTQFNNQEDLRLYPRTLDADVALLEHIGADIVFAPPVEEMYPEPDTRQFDFGPLGEVMEGAFRPGHFNGVAQIVSKLLITVEPDKAYFGEKDFQQMVIIKEMVRQLALPVEIAGVPIVREESGLALSSRNARLSDEERARAAGIYRTLRRSLSFYPEKTPAEATRFVTETINNIDGLHVEYYEIVDAHTLQPVDDWRTAESIVGCVTVYCNDVRLIDNIRYK